MQQPAVKAPRGTADVLPSESYKWHYVEGVLRKTAHLFGFSEIRFPTFEHTELFHRGVGDTTDVVQKEMYTFEDRSGRSITLRPEGTASVVRSFIENSLYAGVMPLKCYYIAPNFRYEKPQAGRLREHHQFGVECFGAADASADAEIIGLAYTCIENLGLTGIGLHLNSIGCPECRSEYYKALREYFADKKEGLCETCLGRLEKNPMRVLDCKSPECKALAKDAPKPLDYLCEKCDGHFKKLCAHLDEMGLAYEIDTSIVRGLDYYTGTVFEFVAGTIGAQSTVLAGGRYDGLVSQLGGQPTPGFGFGAGLERLIMAIESSGKEIPAPEKQGVFIATLGQRAESEATKIVYSLRRKGKRAEKDTMGRSLKAQMRFADRCGTKYAVVLGDNELDTGTVRLKNMEDGTEREIALAEVENFI